MSQKITITAKDGHGQSRTFEAETLSLNDQTRLTVPSYEVGLLTSLQKNLMLVPHERIQHNEDHTSYLHFGVSEEALLIELRKTHEFKLGHNRDISSLTPGLLQRTMKQIAGVEITTSQAILATEMIKRELPSNIAVSARFA